MARVVSGTVALSTTPAQLPSVPCTGVTIHNDDASIVIKLGGSSGVVTFTLDPGQTSGRLQVQNVNQIWAVAASGTPTISYITS